MTNQGDLQQAIRDITSTTYTYNGDWLALFDYYSIAAGTFDERMILWLQNVLNSSSTNINDLKAAYASSLGFNSWSDINIISPQLPGLEAWYDFSNSNFLTLSGTAITQALDRSGNGNHTAVQATSTARPTFTASQQNGLSGAVFDGGDWFDLPSELHSIPDGDLTVIAVAKRSSETGSIETIYSMQESTATRQILAFGVTAGELAWRSNDNSSGTVSKTGATNTNYQIIRGRKAGATQAVTYNNEVEATNSSAADEDGVDRARIAVTNTGLFLTGGILEIMFFNRSLSEAEILSTELYLANKYGLYHPNATWINAYSSSIQLMIHAAKLNRDHPFVQNAILPTIWYDSTNQTFLTLISTAITQFLDKSGNGYDTDVQGTSTARPTFTSSQINGLSAANFDGSSDFLEGSDTITVKTVVIVAQREAGFLAASGLFCEGGSVDDENIRINGTGNDFNGNGAGNADDFSTAVNKMWINNAVGTTIANATPFIITAVGDTSPSIDVQISQDFLGRFWKGDVAEVLVFPTELSSGDRTIVNQFLSNKYNITLS